MKKVHFIAMILLLAIPVVTTAQTAADSLKVVVTMKALLNICRSVNFSDPRTTSLGTFYKAAPYIVYRGNDKKRAWKELCNYNNAEDKKGVDETCTTINETDNRDNNYKIVR